MMNSNFKNFISFILSLKTRLELLTELDPTGHMIINVKSSVIDLIN